MSVVEPESGAKMDLDDSGCVQDGCSPSKSEQSEDVPMRKLELLDFSDEVLFYILKFCTPHSLKALGFTCARLGALVLERSLWNHVDARDVCTNRARMRWMVQNFHVGTRAVLLHGHANEARGCRGHVNRTRKEAEEDKPRFSSGIVEIEVPLGEPPALPDLMAFARAPLPDQAPLPDPAAIPNPAALPVPAPLPNPAPLQDPAPLPAALPVPPPLPDMAAVLNPAPDARPEVENGAGDGNNGEDREVAPNAPYPLRRLPARLMNALNAQQPLPRPRGSPTWPEDCEWDDEDEPAQESSEDTAGCGGPVFTLSADIMRELCIRCPRLYELNLEYCNINCNKINLSSFPTALRRLSLRGTRCYNPPLDKSYLFRIHDYLPVLEHMDLSECAWLEPAALLPLSKMAHLRVLLMRACPAMAEFVAYVSLATRYGFRKLQVLDMRESPVGDSEVSALGWLPELEELHLSAPPPAPPRSPAPHHHYIGDPLPRRPPLDTWETQIPGYYMSRCEEACDSPDAGDDVEAQLSALQAMPPLSIEVRTRLRLPNRNPLNPPNQPPNPPNPLPAPQSPPSTAAPRRRQSEDAPGPPLKRTKRNSGSKDSDDDSDTDDDDDDRDDGAEMDTNDNRDDQCFGNENSDADGARSNSDSSPDKAKKSNDDECKSRYRIFKHKNTFDDAAGSCDGNDDDNVENCTKPPGKCRRYVYKLNYGPLSSQSDDIEKLDKPEDPKMPIDHDKDKKVNEGASTSKEDPKSSENNADKVTEDEEDKPKTENDGTEEKCEDDKTEQSDAKKEECNVNEGASGSRDTKEDSGENRPEGGEPPEQAEESNEARPGPSNADGRTTYHCRIDVQDGASTSRYSIRVQVKNERLHDGPAPNPAAAAAPPPPLQGEPAEGGERDGSDNEADDDDIDGAREVPVEAAIPPPAPAPAPPRAPSPPGGERFVRRVRFSRDRPPVVLRVPAGQRAEQQAEPRHHVLYVNLGQQLHAVYRLLPHRAPGPAPPPDHLDAHSLVSDASIRRFGRADGESVNIVNIGPDGPQFGARDNSGRPNRSNLRILSATGYRHITNRSLAHLATAAPRLQRLDLTGTGVSADGVDRFRVLRPDVHVQYSQFHADEFSGVD